MYMLTGILQEVSASVSKAKFGDTSWAASAHHRSVERRIVTYRTIRNNKKRDIVTQCSNSCLEKWSCNPCHKHYDQNTYEPRVFARSIQSQFQHFLWYSSSICLIEMNCYSTTVYFSILRFGSSFVTTILCWRFKPCSFRKSFFGRDADVKLALKAESHTTSVYTMQYFWHALFIHQKKRQQ